MAYTGLVRALVASALQCDKKPHTYRELNFFEVLLVTPPLDGGLGGLLRLPGDGSLALSDCSQCNPRPWWLKIRSPPRRQVVDRRFAEDGTLTRTETDARARPTRAKGGLGRGLHPKRWGRVTFVWPEKPFRAVSDVYPVTYFPTRSPLRVGREGG